MRNWSVILAVAAILSSAATADGGSPTGGAGNGGLSNATTTSAVPTTTFEATGTTFEATGTTAAAAPMPHSVEVMLSKAENDPNLKYCTMDGLFCIPRNYSK